MSKCCAYCNAVTWQMHEYDCPLISGDKTFPYDIPGMTSVVHKHEEVEIVSIGWKCPVCGRGLAGWVAVCPCYEVAEVVKMPDAPPDEDAPLKEYRVWDGKKYEVYEFGHLQIWVEANEKDE